MNIRQAEPSRDEPGGNGCVRASSPDGCNPSTNTYVGPDFQLSASFNARHASSSPCFIADSMLALFSHASTSSTAAFHRPLSLREPLAADSIPSNPIDIAVI